MAIFFGLKTIVKIASVVFMAYLEILDNVHK